eukprot:6262806-Amphidinium_carterae.1
MITLQDCSLAGEPLCLLGIEGHDGRDVHGVPCNPDAMLDRMLTTVETKIISSNFPIFEN